MERLVIYLIICLAATAAGGVPAPKPAKPDMLVGAYYFPGWSSADRWYCIKANKDVWHPLLGYYREGDPDVADWHIKWALEHGVSFFAFDFYTANGSQMLETALDDGFLKAKHIKDFKFRLNWCNHAPESTMTAEQLDKFGDLVINKYLTHPSYLRIDGKPVVIFLVGHNFIRNMGVDQAKQAFARFEQNARDAGLPGLYLVFCQDAMGTNEIESCKAIGVSAFCRYNYPYAGTGITSPGKHAEFSYQHLSDEGEKMWKQWRDATGDASWPTVMAGWDRRPWTKNEDVIITGMTPQLFADALTKARNYVSKDKIVMIEAWNEWGEGSILEPSVEHGFAYLDAVRKVFCPSSSLPKVGRVGVGSETRHPELDSGSIQLPSLDTWRFDHDAEGWAPGAIDNFHNDWGAMTGTTASADPSMTSPATYLDCKHYTKARIRMMASPANGASGSILSPSKGASTPVEATGQLFWSTTEHGVSEAQSLTFKVALDGQWHEYDIDLASNPQWKGLTDRLRFDPVDQAGIEFSVDEIRLIGIH